MNRLAQAFQQGKALIPFITAGDPSPAVTEKLIPAMAQAGADIIALGVPFSDPVAEGPVIQAADGRALAAGVTTDHVFHLVKNARQSCAVPIVLVTYANPVFSYGAGQFMERCREAGIDGLVVPDLPFEEREEFLPVCRQQGITLISMVAPASEERIKMIAREAEGFVYCVPSMEAMEAPEKLHNQVAGMVTAVKAVKDIPCAVGFDLGPVEQAAELASLSDGALVGSAVMELVGEHGDHCIQPVVEYVRMLKEAIMAGTPSVLPFLKRPTGQ